MAQTWSISTTVRSPERLREFLSVLQDMQGRTWDSEAQIEFQIRLIQARAYGAGSAQFYNGLSQEHIEIINSNEPISFDDAYSIFYSKNYEDPPMRGRTSFSPLQKLGFAMLREKAVYVTDMGEMLLDAGDEHGEVLLRALLKWQFPNPLERGAVPARDCKIKPFVGALRLIEAVNKICEESGEKPKGLSVREFGFFALNLGDWRRIDSIAKGIFRMRQRMAKKIVLKTEFNTEAKKIIGNVDLNNMRDYQDNAIRYFRMTEYVYLRGHGSHIDLDPTRKSELKSLFKRDTAAPLQEFSVWDGKSKAVVLAKYLDYLGSAKTPIMPGESDAELRTAIRVVQAEIKKLGEKVMPVNLKEMSRSQLNRYMKKIRAQHGELVRVDNRKLLKDPNEARDWIKNLRNLSRRNDGNAMSPALRLEYLVSAALDGVLNDAKKVQPNYPVDGHGLPKILRLGDVQILNVFMPNSPLFAR